MWQCAQQFEAMSLPGSRGPRCGHGLDGEKGELEDPQAREKPDDLAEGVKPAHEAPSLIAQHGTAQEEGLQAREPDHQAAQEAGLELVAVYQA